MRSCEARSLATEIDLRKTEEKRPTALETTTVVMNSPEIAQVLSPEELGIDEQG